MDKTWLQGVNKVAFEHARRLTAFHSKSFYLSTRLLPKEKQWATFGLYGFCRYADNLIDNPRARSREELLREIEYLKHELQVAYRTGESEHPILQPFILVAEKFGIPDQYPLDLLKGIRMDLEISRYHTFDDLYLFAYRVAGVVGIMMTYLLGYQSQEAFIYAEKLGIAMQLTNIIRDIAEDAHRGRIYLPQEEMRRHGINDQQLFSGAMTPEFRDLLRFQVERAYHYYDEANPGIQLLDRDAQYAIYGASRIYRGILIRMEARGYNPFLERVFVPRGQKLQILLKEVLRTRLPLSPGSPVPVNP